MKKRTRHTEIQERYFTITSFQASVSIHADKPRGLPPLIDSMTWLELRCRTDEPLAGTHDFQISVHVKDAAEPTGHPPAIGAIIQLKPYLQAVIGLPIADYDRLWTLAIAGLLKYGHFAFTEPYRNRAAVVSASFANEVEE